MTKEETKEKEEATNETSDLTIEDDDDDNDVVVTTRLLSLLVHQPSTINLFQQQQTSPCISFALPVIKVIEVMYS